MGKLFLFQFKELLPHTNPTTRRYKDSTIHLLSPSWKHLTFFSQANVSSCVFLFIFGLNKNKHQNLLQSKKKLYMKKYILTSVMSLFLVLGAGLILTATETETKKETAKSCCSGKTVEAVQTASSCTGVEKTQTASAATKSSCADKSADAACCSSKATKADAESGEVQMIQTSSAAKSSCTGSSAASCTGTKATQVAGPQPGECTKVPSGVKSQQASREN